MRTGQITAKRLGIFNRPQRRVRMGGKANIQRRQLIQQCFW